LITHISTNFSYNLVKLFFLSPQGSSDPLSVNHLHNAIQHLETAIGATSTGIKIDHFILAIPNQTFDENGLDPSEIEQFTEDVQVFYLPIWKRLSELRQSGKIGRLGVSEFSKQQLEILKVAAVNVGAVAPEINQVNLHDCCVLPKELIEYAKTEGIELLTHGDSSGKESRKGFCVG
jgi:diketogulonate reductase-like aldo/keto reductase